MSTGTSRDCVACTSCDKDLQESALLTMSRESCDRAGFCYLSLDRINFIVILLTVVFGWLSILFVFFLFSNFFFPLLLCYSFSLFLFLFFHFE